MITNTRLRIFSVVVRETAGAFRKVSEQEMTPEMCKVTSDT